MPANHEIYIEAVTAAVAAGKAHKPTPMVVGQAVGLFGNAIVPGTEEVVEDGVCGFAWVKIKPARGPFIAWLKANNIGSSGVYGGWEISMGRFPSFGSLGETNFGQSMERKEAAGDAFAAVLKSHGIRAWMVSRID